MPLQHWPGCSTGRAAAAAAPRPPLAAAAAALLPLPPDASLPPPDASPLPPFATPPMPLPPPLGVPHASLTLVSEFVITSHPLHLPARLCFFNANPHKLHKLQLL